MNEKWLYGPEKIPGLSRNVPADFFHVIAFPMPARLIKPMRVQNQTCSGFIINHQPGWLASCNTGLKVISHTELSSPANRANLAHIIRPILYDKLFPRYSLATLLRFRQLQSFTSNVRRSFIHENHQKLSSCLNICYWQTNNDSQWIQAYRRSL